MDEFPKNSRKAAPEPPTDTPEAAKKVERVITSDVIRRKQPLGSKFRSTFFGSDAKRTWTDVVKDVLVPAAKDMITDAVVQGVERMVYGEPRSRGRRPGMRTDNQSYISYNRYGNGSSPVGRASGLAQRRDEGRPITKRGRATHDFDEIILGTRVEAEAVIDGLFELISKYEQATVADLYELVGIAGEYTDERWGWTNIRGADVSRVREGYLLDLPKPEPLE